MEDEFAEFTIDDEQFEQAEASAVADPATFRTTGACGVLAGERTTIEPLDLVADGGGDVGAGPAGGTDAADEALGEDAVEGGGDEERFDAHVDEACDGAGGIVGVEGGEDLMAGEGGADGDFGGLGIADFADHDDIGILAEDGTEAGGEGEAAAGFDGDLGYAVELIFDGVFDGDDLLFGGIDSLQDGVEGGGFSRAGGAGGEEEAVGFADEGLEEASARGIEAEFLGIEQPVVSGEETEDDAFAMDGGHGADADVDAFAAVMDLDVAVLGKEPFGDVHVGHDLDAGDQGGMEVSGRGRLGLEDAVDAVAEFDGGFEGEEMDVAGAFAEGGGDDDVDEVDDGGFVGGDLDVVEVFSFGTGGLCGVEILDHPFHGDLVGIGEALGDFGGGTDFNRDFEAGEQTEIVDEFGGGRVDGGDVKDAVAGVEG